MPNTNFTKEEKNGYFVLFERLMKVEEFEDTNTFSLDAIKKSIDYCIENYLKEDEREAVILRYGLNNNGCSRKMTFKEVGENFGESQEYANGKVNKVFHNPIPYRVKEIALNGDKAIKEFEDHDRAYSHLSEFPYKIYDEDKEYIKDHYKYFPLHKTNLDQNIVRILHKHYIYWVGVLLDIGIEKVEKRMKPSRRIEMRNYVYAIIANVVSLNVSDESSEELDMENVSDIMDRIDKLKEQIKINDSDAYIKQKEIQDSNNERNKVLEEEIESLQSMINGKEVD